VPGLCLGYGHRPYRDAEIRHAGPARVLRRRCTLAVALRLPAARLPDTCGRIERVSTPLKDVIRSPLDRLFFSVVTLGWNEGDIAQYRQRLKRYNEVLTTDIIQAFEQIDSKATGLLTHVSLMIAGLGLIAPLLANNDAELAVVVFEIAVYLLIAVG